MKADFSRLTFAEKNHYRRVLMQQGRVEIDADGNEQIAIGDHIAATTSTDVIGQSGYPVTAPPAGSATGGFALGLNAARTDITIAPGRMYVDGLLVENDAPDATLLTQPDMPGVTLSHLGVNGSGSYVVYLDVWERLITALDNPAIRESALGGPDTSVRTKLVWQVKLAPPPPVKAGPQPEPTCANSGEPWPSASTGMLAAGSGTPTASLPCSLPPETGYQRLENQLYRVEIHTPGPDGTATFKWSRENGSVVSLISARPTPGGSPPATVTGPSFWVTSLSSDPSLGLRAGDWVELTDDSTELIAGSGTLYQVATTPTDGHTVTITATPPPTVTLALHPKLRRWDQTGTGLSQGITVTAGTWIPLEGGVQVEFSAGNYHAGDYWLIPARTATSIQQGYVEWPVDAASNPMPQPSVGIRHHYAKLGLIEFTAPGTFGGIGTATAPIDCRLPFMPLTDLMPKQSLSPCTIVAKPGPGWEQPILAYFADATASGGDTAPLDAEICLPIGDFPVNNPVVISGAGHVRFTGAGWGTRLIPAAGNPESVLQFTDCASVAVRDLYSETSQVTKAAGSTGRKHINGTLAFSNCGEVTVENAWLKCGSNVSHRGAACITVSSDVTPANTTTGTGSVRIRGCRLYVGEMQVGIQLVHQARAVVEDNEIAVDPAVPATNLPSRLTDPAYLAIARSYLISQASLPTAPSKSPSPAAPAIHAAPAEEAATPAEEAGAPPAAEPPAEEAKAAAATPAPVASILRGGVAFDVGNQTLNFVTSGDIGSTWQTYLNANAPKEFATPADALRYVKTAANTILTNAQARTGLSGFGAILHLLNEHVPLAGRGIVVGGQAIGDLHIANNAISGVIMGISVGVSHRASAAETRAKQRTPDHMQTIRIADNIIACHANDVTTRKARFGIFVGSANSLEIDGNRLTLTPVGISAVPSADAIRAVGYLHLKAIIRHNHMTGFPMGIRVVPLTGDGPGKRAAPGFTDSEAYLLRTRPGTLWLIADNAIEGATTTPSIGPFWKTKAANIPQNPSGAQNPEPYIDAPSCMQINNVHA
jgi:hypothetical protein